MWKRLKNEFTVALFYIVYYDVYVNDRIKIERLRIGDCTKQAGQSKPTFTTHGHTTRTCSSKERGYLRGFV